MNKYKFMNLSLSVLCFVIVWSINENILSLVTIPGKPNLNWIVRIISAIGIFAFLFEFMVWLSHYGASKWWADEAKIIGDWFQVFHIQNYDKPESACDAIRHGPVSINMVGQLLEISATNLKLDESAAPSSWHSNKVSLQGSQIWLLFSSNGPGRGTTHGNMLYHFQGRKPQKLVGQFSDSSPARHFGSIELFREKEDYETRLDQLKARNDQSEEK